MTKKLLLSAVIPFCLVFTGCPDYSHLREAPDYKNMTDSGGETGEQTAETPEAEK